MNRFELNPGNGQELVRRGVDAPPAPATWVRGPVEALGSPEVESGDYLRILWRGRWVLLLFTLLGVGGALVFSMRQQPMYQARTSVEVQTAIDTFSTVRGQPGGTADSQVPIEVFVETQARLLESESLMDRAIRKLKLDQAPEFAWQPERPAAWKRLFGLPQAKPLTPLQRARKTALARLSVKPTGQTRLIDIRLDWPDAEMAATLTNTLVQEYIEQNLETRWKAAQYTGDWLTRQLEGLKTKIARTDGELQNYANATDLLFTSDEKRSTVAEEKLRQVQAELSRAQAEMAVAQAQYETSRTTPPEMLPKLMPGSPMGGYLTSVAELRRQLANLRSMYTPAHYKVQQVEAQVAELEALIGKERSNTLSHIQTDYVAAERRVRLLATDYNAQMNRVKQQGRQEIYYNTLKREGENDRQLYDAMLSRVKEAGVAAAAKASNVNVVDAATAPASPYRPDPVLNSSLGLMGGLLFGLVFVFLRERTNSSFRTPGDAHNYLGIPELAVIPASKLQLTARTRSNPLSLVGEEAGGGRRPTLETASWNEGDSLLAESFRSARTSILQPGRNRSAQRVVVLTSASPGEGKTLSACNLAISLAQVCGRVLLVDGDTRRPRLHQVFGIDNRWGLSTLLQDPTPCQRRSMSDLGRQTESPGLWVLPAGPPEPEMANLLCAPRMGELVARFREEFEVVVIDTPPMLQISDARVLAQLADGVILVLRAGKTRRESARFCRELLESAGTTVIGTILNGWDPRESDKYYGSAYKYQRYASAQGK